MAGAGKTTSTGTTRFIGGIDGLRALAVLSVLFYHLEPSWLPSGYVGVDVFFVISGFVVAHSVYDSGKTRFSDYFLWFYRRRLSRIMPALFAYILIIALLGMLLLPFSPATKLIDVTGISAIIGASNFVLLWRAGDYFSAATEFNTFTHTWSLAVEEQYYLLFPFLSYFLIVRRDDRKAIRKAVVALTIAMCVASLAAAWHFTTAWRDFTFYMLPTRFWELGLGLLLRCLLDGWSRRDAQTMGHGLVSAIAILALVALLASFWITPVDAFPFPGALLPCLSTGALIIAVWLFAGNAADKALSHGALRFVGKISYSLYLWHWGVIVLMRWTTGLESLPLKALALVLMFGLAILSYFVIEQPLRHSRPLRSATMLRFFGGFAVVGAAMVAGTVAMALARPLVGLSVTNDRLAWDPYSLPKVTSADCPVQRTEASLAGGNEIAFLPRCSSPARPKVFIAGDSHAGAYERMALHLAGKARTEVRILSRGGCPLMDGAYLEPRPYCADFRSQVLQRVQQSSRPGDILFVAALYTPRYRDQWGTRNTLPASGAPASPRDGAIVALKGLAPFARLQLDIVLEAPKPTLPTALFRCADTYTRINPYCKQSADVLAAEQMLRRSKTLEMLRLVAAATPGGRLWDPFPLLCPGRVCRGYQDGKPLYFDTYHLSAHGNMVLLPAFLELMKTGPRTAAVAGLDPRLETTD